MGLYLISIHTPEVTKIVQKNKIAFAFSLTMSVNDT